MTWFLAATVLLLGAVLWAVPRLGRPTAPLGVAVPRAHVDDPAVTHAVHGYRRDVALATAVVLVLTVALGLVLPEAAVGAVPLLLVVAGLSAYVRYRGRIVRAKAEGRWYDGIPVRLVADVVAPHPRFCWWPYALALLVALATLGYGIGVYDRQPDPMPTHFGADGTPDAWSAKSVWSVLGLPLLGLAMVALLTGLGWVISRAPARVAPTKDPEAARAAAARSARVGKALVASLTVAMAVGFALFAIQEWNAVTGPLVLATFIGFLVVTLGLVGWGLAASTAAATQEAEIAMHSPARADAPDDDRHWRWGMVYDNPQDPALMVPKRAGSGWTINYGRPAGKAITWAILLVPLASLVLTFALG